MGALMSKDETSAHLRGIMNAIVPALPGCGVVLFVFPIGAEEGNRVNYISNVPRSDMVAALREVLARFESRGHGEADMLQ